MKVTVWLAWCNSVTGNVCDVTGTLDGALELIEREVRAFHVPADDGELRFELRNVDCTESVAGEVVSGLAVDVRFGDGQERFCDPWYLLERTIEVASVEIDPIRSAR